MNDDTPPKCSRCSAPTPTLIDLVKHVFMHGRGGDATCIGAELPGPTVLDLIREERRRKMH